jgi:hypothetical protein
MCFLIVFFPAVLAEDPCPNAARAKKTFHRNSIAYKRERIADHFRPMDKKVLAD